MSEYEAFTWGLVIGVGIMYIAMFLYELHRVKNKWLRETERINTVMSRGHEVYVDEKIETPEWVKR